MGDKETKIHIKHLPFESQKIKAHGKGPPLFKLTFD